MLNVEFDDVAEYDRGRAIFWENVQCFVRSDFACLAHDSRMYPVVSEVLGGQETGLSSHLWTGRGHRTVIVAAKFVFWRSRGN